MRVNPIEKIYPILPDKRKPVIVRYGQGEGNKLCESEEGEGVTAARRVDVWC
jgi:hypothetical protein